MKKVILSMMIAIFTLPCFNAHAEKVNVNMKGDSVVVVTGRDTVTMKSSALKSIAERIEGKLNDTLLTIETGAGTDSNADVSSGNYSSAPVNTYNGRDAYSRGLDQLDYFVKSGFRFAVLLLCGVVLIVLLCIIAYLLNRRAKYKIIEKAIDNNYPLPDNLFGKNVPRQTIYVTEQTYQANPRQQVQQPQQAVPQGISLGDIITRMRYTRGGRSGMNLMMVGLCLVVFFLVVDAEVPAGICSILMLLGAGKLALAYFESKNVIVQQQDNTQQAQTPQQPQNPPMPTQQTPPPFEQNSVNEKKAEQ